MVLPTLFIFALTISLSPLSAQQSDSAGEIHIDQRCHVLAQPAPTPARPNPRPAFHSNFDVCHLESEHRSSHWEETIQNGVPRDVRVTIREREYVLHNITGTAVTFIVAQPLPKGWRIDSDPQPSDVTGNIATFRVSVQPGKTIRLHVGERH